MVSFINFRVLFVKDFWLGCDEGCLIQVVGDCVYFYVQCWDCLGVENVFSRYQDLDWGFYWDYYLVVGFQELKLFGSQILCWDYVGVKFEVFVVCIFVVLVLLMFYGFNCEMGVVNFIYKVKNVQRGEGNQDKNNCWKNSLDDFNFLGVQDVFIGEFGGDYGYNDVKYQCVNQEYNY